jgi:RNA polymerase sigma-70 factor, ECF subfamily
VRPSAQVRTDCVPDVGDRVWAERIRAGDAAAFELVFRRLTPGLRAFVFRYVRSEEVAEELVQDLFLTLWRQRERLAIQHSLVTYLFTAARNRALNHLNRERLAKKADPVAASAPGEPPTIEDDLVEAELARTIQEAIARLPERTRLVFTMSRQERLTYAEIAERLGLSVKTVETQMGRALRQMRVHLREFLA